jgi:hypothetical protein
MWPLPKIEESTVTFSFSSDHLFCTLIEKINTAPFAHITHYQKYNYSDLTIAHKTIFNPTIIKQLINDFLIKHKKQNARIIFSLAQESITEKYITLNSDRPSIAHFGFTPSHHCLWGYRFMYHNEHGQSVFYFYRASRSLVLQYQLIAIALRLNLIDITTDQMALFYAYKKINDKQFRQTQYALDMAETDNNIGQKIDRSSCARALSLSELDYSNNSTDFAIAYGLFTTIRDV